MCEISKGNFLLESKVTQQPRSMYAFVFAC